MVTFIIGEKEYPVKLTYAVKRHFNSAYVGKDIQAMTKNEHEDIYLEAALLSLPSQSFRDIEDMKAGLSWDEYDVIEKFFQDRISSYIEKGKSETEKKQETN